MPGVFANTATVIIGSLLGLICKKGLSRRLTDAIMVGIGMCTAYIGFSGTLQGSLTLVLILSIVFGALIGTALRLDERLDALGDRVARRFQKADTDKASVAEGFVTASLLFCVGSMTIVGSLNAGILGDYEMLYTKSILDFISDMMLSASLGIGVLCSAVVVLVLQGAIVLLSTYLEPLLSAVTISEMTCAGSLLIFVMGLNLMGITKIKVITYLRAILFVPLLVWLSANAGLA